MNWNAAAGILAAMGLGCLTPFSPAFADPPGFAATSPVSLQVLVSPGEIALPDGRTVSVAAQTLSFDPPEMRDFEIPESDAPADYQPFWDTWDPWPGVGKPLKFSPPRQDSTPILGGLYRAFREETLVVASADGSKTYRNREDFRFNADWGLLANVGGCMTGKITAKIRGALQRLDLVQVSGDGKLSVKKGKSVLVCPDLPGADPGCVPLAGIYIAAWPAARNPHFDAAPGALRGAGDYAITDREIFPIGVEEPVAPVNAKALAQTLAKLRKPGSTVKIAFMGDSITLGAEATQWFRDEQYGKDDTTYRGRLVYALRQRFPKSVIEPIAAYKGAATIKLATSQIDAVLADNKPDLVLVAFGANDVHGPVGGAPMTPLDDFASQLAAITQKSRQAGAEVLLVTTFPLNPWIKSGMAQRQPAYHARMRQVAEENGAAFADVHSAFGQLAKRGIPPWSTLHNGINHPGDLGHAVYADVLLRFFPE